MSNFFSQLEKDLKEKIPSDLIRILEECGFDSESALSCITSETINEIEQFVNNDLSILKTTSYEDVVNFKLKPGHKAFIINIPNRMNQLKKETLGENVQSKISDFSYILRTFIETADMNKGKHPKGFRYNETNRYFSTFIYLMCGKACYEALSANLPIPQANTIRKIHILNFIVVN